MLVCSLQQELLPNLFRMRPFEGADEFYVVLVVFLPLFSECYGIPILLLNLFGFLFALFLIENGVWVVPEGVRFHGFGFRVTSKLKKSTSQKKGVEAVLGSIA